MPIYASFPLGTTSAAPPVEPTDMSWTSGSVWSDWEQVYWQVPSAPTLAVGDIVHVFGVSRQDTGANKWMSTPTGFGFRRGLYAADYACDIVHASSTVDEAELASPPLVTFGVNSRRIDWLIVRNPSSTFSGNDGASTFTSPLAVPSITGAETGGVHVVSLTASGAGATVTTVPAGYASQYTPPNGWHGGGLWIKSPSDMPTGAIEFAATASADLAMSAMSIWLHPQEA